MVLVGESPSWRTRPIKLMGSVKFYSLKHEKNKNKTSLATEKCIITLEILYHTTCPQVWDTPSSVKIMVFCEISGFQEITFLLSVCD